MDEKDKKIFDSAIDALIKAAAIDAANEMFDEIDTSIRDDEITFSDNHINKINEILSSIKYEPHKNKHHKINKRILLVAIITMVIVLVAAILVTGDKLKFLN